jgi:hypothetical protein
MPSPLRKKEVATIAYTRWEAVDAEEEEQLEESAQIHVRWTNSGQFFNKKFGSTESVVKASKLGIDCLLWGEFNLCVPHSPKP